MLKMKKAVKFLTALSGVALLSSCSVQQFAVNTQVSPFQNGGKVWGEKTKGVEFKKDWDLHLLGINIRNSDAKKMAEELGTKSYTIESKSNILVNIITGGIADYKVVKVIKREM